MKNPESNEPDLIDLVQSSVNEIDIFERSLIWTDFKAILNDWNAGLKGDYDNAGSMEDVKYLQGISQCIKYVLNLPDAMRNIIKQSQEDKNES